jgi:acyl-CoA reductase-like NAD-dependent aldehyde dehydrogenase
LTQTDRRHRPRMRAKRTIQLESQNGEQTSHLAEMDTLSTRGVSVTISAPLSESVHEFTIRIPLPDGGTMVEATVEKIWQLAGGDGSHKYGFMFSGLRSIDFRAIQATVERALAQNQQVAARRERDRRAERAATNGSSRRISSRRWKLLTYPLYIDGRDVDTGEYEYFPYADQAITDPKGTSEVLLRLKNGEMPERTADYIFARACVGDETHNARAIQSARRAFRTFGSFPMAKRMKIFEDIHTLLLKHKEKILELFVSEGHPRKLGEWEFSGMLQAFTAETVSFYKTEVAKNRRASKTENNLLIRKPDGVVCVSPTRNAASSKSFTGALSLLGGNTIILKPPLTLPISTIYLWRHVVDEALRKNGAPKGTLNIVVGNTAKFINQWIMDPGVNDIVYFGESNRGLEIGNKIYLAGKKPVLELSGKDVMLIWEDCDIEAAADSLVDCFLGSTQICMVPKMALIHEGIYDAFAKVFLEKVRQLKVGLPSDPTTCLSPVSKIGTFFAFLEDALAKGGQLLYGGQRLNYKGEPDGKGVYLQPTLLEIDDRLTLSEFRCVKEEIFFPLLPLVKISGNPVAHSHRHQTKNDVIFQKMVKLIEDNDYGLRVSVWCRPNSLIRRFIREIHNCGLLRINCRHVDFSMYLATHGGTRKTGGPFGELNYFWLKTTHLQGISVRA